MDMKYKVIISIFIIIIAFYFIQFIITQIKPKEHFTEFDDDDEDYSNKYEQFNNSPPSNKQPNKILDNINGNKVINSYIDAPSKQIPVTTESKPVPVTTESKQVPVTTESKPVPVTTESKPMPIVQETTMQSDPLTKLRFWLFNYLTQNINSQIDRNNTYDIVSQENVLLELLPMDNTNRINLINSYIKKEESPTIVPSIIPTIPDTTKSINPTNLNNNNTTVTPENMTDYFTSPETNQISAKFDNVINSLNSVKTGLTDLKNVVMPSTTKETYKPVLPEFLSLPKVAPLIQQFSNKGTIEGFENVRQFALY